MSEAHKPAFPLMTDDGHYTGLTKLECFAGQIMAGLAANNKIDPRDIGDTEMNIIADHAIEMATALIDALNRNVE